MKPSTMAGIKHFGRSKETEELVNGKDTEKQERI